MSTTIDEKKTIVWGKHQSALIRSNPGHKYVGLFGGLGNGKTFAACYYVIALATNYQNNLILVGRLTYPELRDSTKEIFFDVLRKCYPEGAWTENKSENSITFWNGSKVIFRHLDNPANLLSINLGGFYIDQAEEIDEDTFKVLQGRLRRVNIPVRKGIITGNPQGHNWCYTNWGLDQALPANITPTSVSHAINHFKKFDSIDKITTTYTMVTASTMANLANLPPEYVSELRTSYGDEMFARYVLGSWDAYEGQIFDVAKVKSFEPNDLPPMVMVLTACDPAISKEKDACNTAFVTLGIGSDGLIYCLEVLAGKWNFLEQINLIKQIEQRWKPKYFGVENVAYQAALYESAKQELKGVQVIDLKADKDKFRRAKSVTTIVDKGLFRSNDTQLLSEMTAFRPDAKGKERKDRVDALVHAFKMVQLYAPIIGLNTKHKEKVIEPEQPMHFKEYLKLSRMTQAQEDFEFEDYSESPSYHNDEYY